jgi:hypothetical protein
MDQIQYFRLSHLLAVAAEQITVALQMALVVVLEAVHQAPVALVVLEQAVKGMLVDQLQITSVVAPEVEGLARQEAL